MVSNHNPEGLSQEEEALVTEGATTTGRTVLGVGTVVPEAAEGVMDKKVALEATALVGTVIDMEEEVGAVVMVTTMEMAATEMVVTMEMAMAMEANSPRQADPEEASWIWI